MNGHIIPTVTLNPSLDEAVAVDEIVLGSTNRCALDALDAGGKGINASRVIHRLGRATLAFGCIGGVTGQLLRRRLLDEGVPLALDEVEEMTRLNVMIAERTGGRRTRLYLPGARVEPEQAAAILRRLIAVMVPGTYVVLAGSLPPGLEPALYRDFVVALRQAGIRAVVDTSGTALATVLAAHPALIKPNVEEAAEVLGRPLEDDGAVLDGARELQRRGAERVVISQGSDGAIGIGPEGAWKAVPPAIEACSTVGSGDSMVAGMVVALNEGKPLPEALRLGTAAGAATAMVRGTKLCEAAEVAALLPSVEIRALAAGQADALAV